MKFFHIADTHLGAIPDAGFAWSEERRSEIWESFRSVVAKADREEVDLLLIAGDLFHRQPLMRELKEVNYLFSTLKKTKVVFIIGNHDYLKVDSYYLDFPWSENVTCLRGKECESVVFEDLDTEVYGLSYHTREIKEPKYNDLQPEKKAGFSILLGHGGDAKHIPIDRKKLLLSGFDYIALGYEHKASVMQSMHMAYAGSLEPLSVHETGKHGFILGEINEDSTTIRFVPFACREYINIKVRLSSDITEDELEEKLTAAINQYGRDNIFTISLEGRYQPKEPYDRARLLALGNVADVKDGTMPDYNLVALLDEHKDDMIGMYLEEFLKEPAGTREQKALYCGLEALLNAVQKTQ